MNIFSVPPKTSINCSMKSKSIIVCGKSKTGKSTLCSQAPRPIFLMTENGMEGLTGFTPIPIGSWSEFKTAVNQLCTPKGRESFDTVVIDSYTNLILLLDKYIGQKLTTDKVAMDFGSDAEYGRGSRAMKNELGIQLQRLANQGYLLLNIVHAEDKVDFNTKRNYIGTSLSNSLYGVAEKFVDQIVYLTKEENPVTKKIEHKIWFNQKGGFSGTGGRWTPNVDSIECSYKNLEKVMLDAMTKAAQDSGAEVETSEKPLVVIEVDKFNFTDLKNEFQEIVDKVMQENAEVNASKIRTIVESVLGTGKKVGDLGPAQSELLQEIIDNLKREFEGREG